MEYPIVVDFNNDGAAEIIAVGGSATGTFTPPLPGKLQAYSSAGAKWAPARKVWNQYSYNAVNVNEDLTIPRHLFNPATVFPNGERPYNNFLQQQTTLNTDGDPLWLTPDFVFTGTMNTHYYTAGDSLVISNLCVENTGDARGNDSLQIAIYRNVRAPANLIRVYKLPAAIEIGATRCYTIKLTGILSISAATLHIELNDDGRRHPQPECDTLSNNNGSIAFSSIPIARNDRLSLFACESKAANVLANDLNVASATPIIIKNGALGTATVSGQNIAYSTTGVSACETLGNRRDTIVYRVCSGSNCSDAQLAIYMLRRPSVKLHDSCSRRPYLTVNYQYLAATYQWYTSPDGSTWAPVSGATGLKHYVNESAWYKVEISYDGEVIETQKAHFVVHRKSRMQGNLWWYTTSLSDY